MNDIEKNELQLWGISSYVSILITVAILSFLVSRLNLPEVWRKFQETDKLFLLIAGSAHYATYYIRGMRWRSSLSRFQLEDGNSRFALMIFFYNFIDNIVPGKLADVYGSHLARINLGIGRSAALGSIVFLRMLDAWVIFFAALLSSWIIFSSRLPSSILWSLIVGGIIALGATSLLLVIAVFNKFVPSFFPERILDIIRRFHDGMLPRSVNLMPILLMTFTIWILESLWIYFLVLAYGIDLSPGKLLFITTIPLLASAFPITPSGTGLVELTLFSCLRVISIESSVAASLTVVNRFIDYWLHILLGLFLFIFRRFFHLHTWREIKTRNLYSPEVVYED